MGCLWAARLWQCSQGTRPSLPVTLLLRDETELARYRQQQGILLEDAGITTLLPVPALTITDAPRPVSHLLLATKAQDAMSALHTVSDLVDDSTRLVLLQNGLKLQREISAAWGAERVFCLSTTHGSWRRGPFHVVHAGHGEGWLGTLADRQDFTNSLLHYLPEVSMSLHADPDIATRLWRKFAINCAVNALTVIHHCRNGELLTLPSAHAELITLCAEIKRIYAGLPEAPALPNFYEQVAQVLHATAENWSSTLQDVHYGRQTEIDHLNVYLCELARKQGLDCSTNEDILHRFHAIRKTTI